MKIIKGLAIFAVLNALLGCFDPPVYDANPTIDFIKLEFVEVGGPSDADSLNLYIDFKDGDGDLGLTTDQIDSPYHSTNFFVGQNQTKTAVSSRAYGYPSYTGLFFKSSGKTPRDFTFVIDSTPDQGKFISLSDRTEYNLPPYEAPYNCTAYHQAYLNEKEQADTIYVWAEDVNSLQPETIVDTLVDGNNRTILYAALGYWYIEPNPNHYNITVKFLKRESNGVFTEFDFREEYCTTYDGRFPVLADSKRAVEGTLKYAMIGTGFLSSFSINTLKLEIQIKDRALNESNGDFPIQTPEFTLNDIRK